MGEKNEEKMVVYESLRNEIISTQTQRANYIVYMYAVYGALLTIGAQTNRIYFVFSYLILILFQSRIHRCKYTISRLSAYIRVFFEEDSLIMNWETICLYEDIKNDQLKANNKIVSVLSGTSAFYLGWLSLICFFVSFISNRFNGIQDVCLILVSLMCLYILYLLSDDYKVEMKHKVEMAKKYRNYKKAWSKIRGDFQKNN